MAGKTRLQISRADIIEYFDELPDKVHRPSDIARHLAEKRDFWRLTQDQSVNDFILFLISTGKLWKANFPFPKPYKKEIRYVWGEIPMYEVMLTLKPDCHYSHYTAIRLHGLTEQVPKTVYINFEQPSGSMPTGELSQRSIDSAFKRPPRVTSFIAESGDFRVCMLNGKNTGYLGVIEQEVSLGEELFGKVRVTSVERTLIDSTVRPAYAGGTAEVLKAFELAKDKVSVNRLAATLKQLNHIYPYHQAIGFYLERAGYKPQQLDLLREIPMEFDFYLAHKMGETEYVKDWRLHVPKGF